MARAGLRVNDGIRVVDHTLVTTVGQENVAGDDTIQFFVSLVKRSVGVPLELEVVREGVLSAHDCDARKQLRWTGEHRYRSL